jgi:Na+/H+ antiporter NhaA
MTEHGPLVNEQGRHALSDMRALVGRTARSRADSALRRFLGTESGSAAVLFAAAVAALLWVNVDGGSYLRVWHTTLSIQISDYGVAMQLRDWVNSGLMTFFFLVIGLEARREFDLGEFRERNRVVLPVLAGCGGMLGAIGVYLACNAGRDSSHGWGTAMSTDTAFALGMLALVGRRVPDRLRGFILTVVVVDDLLALLVIATVYAEEVHWQKFWIAVAFFAGIVLLALARLRLGLLVFALGIASWVAMLKSGVDPLVVGLAAGLLVYAAPASRTDLELATESFRGFREQPTPELLREASVAMNASVSPNDRLQQLYHPWTSYVLVPLFALANAGVHLNAGFIVDSFRSPITLGIMLGYLVGKPVGVTLTCVLVTKLTRGRLRPPVGWAAVAGGGAITGVGFTVSLLIASLAFANTDLDRAKFGILCSAVFSSAVTWLWFVVVARLPKYTRIRWLLGGSKQIVDLADPVDPERDHIRGPAQSPVTLLEYGDFECPYCGLAEQSVRELLAEVGDLRYVWRHLPLDDVHPRARLAAEAAEAAGAQGAFWEMHQILLQHQDALTPKDLRAYAEQLGLDGERVVAELRDHKWADRVAADVESADLSDVAGTPTFFVNGVRHTGAYDLDSLLRAVREARARAALLAPT